MSGARPIDNAFTTALRASGQLKLIVAETFAGAAEKIVCACVESLVAGGKLMFCGNGGSASDSQHLATEMLVRFRSGLNRCPLSAIALTLDPTLLTAAGNDFGFESVFERPLRALGRGGDVLFALTTSGRSANVIRALEAARRMEILTVGLLGATGQPAELYCDHAIVVPSSDTARIQECHITIGHAIIQMIEDRLLAQGLIRVDEG